MFIFRIQGQSFQTDFMDYESALNYVRNNCPDVNVLLIKLCANFQDVVWKKSIKVLVLSDGYAILVKENVS